MGILHINAKTIEKVKYFGFGIQNHFCLSFNLELFSLSLTNNKNNSYSISTHRWGGTDWEYVEEWRVQAVIKTLTEGWSQGTLICHHVHVINCFFNCKIFYRRVKHFWKWLFCYSNQHRIERNLMWYYVDL